MVRTIDEISPTVANVEGSGGMKPTTDDAFFCLVAPALLL